MLFLIFIEFDATELRRLERALRTGHTMQHCVQHCVQWGGHTVQLLREMLQK